MPPAPPAASSRRLVACGLLIVGLVGVVLARTPEGGVRLRHESLPTSSGGEVPVLWIEPEGGARGTAILTHGITATKETLRPLGEALALAGYRCCLADLPGHGDSRTTLTEEELAATYVACAEALVGPGAPPRVDLLVGHSFGASTGAQVLADGRLAANVFVAVGARPNPEEGARKFVLVSGVQDEVLRPDEARRHAASLLGALTLLPLPRVAGRRAAAVGALAALGVALAASAALHGMALAALPTPARLGLALPLTAATLGVSAGLGRTLRRAPRLANCSAAAAQGFLVVGALLLTAAEAAWGQRFLALVYGLLALLMLGSALLGALLERRVGAAWAGHAAFAVMVGYVPGVWFGSLVL